MGGTMSNEIPPRLEANAAYTKPGRSGNHGRSRYGEAWIASSAAFGNNMSKCSGTSSVS